MHKRPLERIDCLRMFCPAVFFGFALVYCLFIWYPVCTLGQSIFKGKYGGWLLLYRSRDGKTMTLEQRRIWRGGCGRMPAARRPSSAGCSARTYTFKPFAGGVKRMNILWPLRTHIVVYRNESSSLRKTWMNGSWQDRQAVSNCREVMYYEGIGEQPLFHSSSGGKTENSRMCSYPRCPTAQC